MKETRPAGVSADAVPQLLAINTDMQFQPANGGLPYHQPNLRRQFGEEPTLTMIVCFLLFQGQRFRTRGRRLQPWILTQLRW